MNEPELPRVENCKSMRKVFEVTMARYANKVECQDLYWLTKGLYKQYNKFHPEKNIEVNVPEWKGKSSLQIIKGLDRIIIITYQKPSKDEEPKEVRTEVSKEELQAMIDSIIKLKNYQPIKTESLSMVFSATLNLGHDGWNTGNKQFFSDRFWHNKYTRILQAFQELGVIEYKAGKTTILDKDKLNIQLLLNN